MKSCCKAFPALNNFPLNLSKVIKDTNRKIFCHWFKCLSRFWTCACLDVEWVDYLFWLDFRSNLCLPVSQEMISRENRGENSIFHSDVGADRHFSEWTSARTRRVSEMKEHQLRLRGSWMKEQEEIKTAAHKFQSKTKCNQLDIYEWNE